ncbi:Nucleoside-triphosphatase THEP1 [Actinobacillus pleuropneumoniae]|nr:Nucleoside-triphosphatase THEP1 [Actinobacillus pleuropneumoniae]
MFEQSKHLVAGKPLNAKTAFLVTGKPRMGKTTMIKKLIHHLGSDLCGGFYTEEITNAGDRIGFRCVAVDGESVEIANVESPSHIRVGRYGVDVEKFEDFAIHKLREPYPPRKSSSSTKWDSCKCCLPLFKAWYKRLLVIAGLY